MSVQRYQVKEAALEAASRIMTGAGAEALATGDVLGGLRTLQGFLRPIERHLQNVADQPEVFAARRAATLGASAFFAGAGRAAMTGGSEGKVREVLDAVFDMADRYERPLVLLRADDAIPEDFDDDDFNGSPFSDFGRKRAEDRNEAT